MLGFKMSFVSCDRCARERERERERESESTTRRTTVALSRRSDRTLIAPIRHGPRQNLIISVVYTAAACERAYLACTSIGDSCMRLLTHALPLSLSLFLSRSRPPRDFSTRAAYPCVLSLSITQLKTGEKERDTASTEATSARARGSAVLRLRTGSLDAAWIFSRRFR